MKGEKKLRGWTVQSILFRFVLVISIFAVWILERKNCVVLISLIRPKIKIKQSIRDIENALSKMAACWRFYFYLFEFQCCSKRYFRHEDARSLINIETNSQLKYFDVSTFFGNGHSIPSHPIPFHFIHLLWRPNSMRPGFGEEGVSYAYAVKPKVV